MSAPSDPRLLHVQHLADRFGRGAALECDGRTLTYEELAREVSLLAPKVQRSSEVCAILAHRSVEAFVALYTCLSLRRPVLLISPASPEDTRRSLLERVGATDCYSEHGWSEHRAPATTEKPHPNDHVLLPTSGTTGEPKIVCLTRESLVASARVSNDNLGLTEGDRWALTLPYAHVGGLSILVRCALAGATVVSRSFRFDTQGDVERLSMCAITHLSLVPTQLQRALETAAPCPTSLRAVLVGGASSPPGLRASARRAGWPVAFTYGFTEAASQVCTQDLKRALGPDPERDVGRPLRGTEVALDGSGRIAVRGPTIMHRYWGCPPREPHGWFVTQDYGYWDAADRLVISGRADNMIISGGENVAAERVEEALVTLPFVEEAAVFGLDDETWGQRIVALVSGTATDVEQIRAALRDQLEPYALPKEVAFCSALPRLPTGKVDRKAAQTRLMNLRSSRGLDPRVEGGKLDP